MLNCSDGVYSLTPPSLCWCSGDLRVLPGELVSVGPGEGPGGSAVGHRAGLDPHVLLRLPAAHLGRLRPGHHPGNPAAGYTGALFEF